MATRDEGIRAPALARRDHVEMAGEGEVAAAGRAVAEELAREGASLVLCARGGDALRAGLRQVA